MPTRALCTRVYTHSHAFAYTHPERFTPSNSWCRRSSGWESEALGSRRKAEGESNEGPIAGLPDDEVWVAV